MLLECILNLLPKSYIKQDPPASKENIKINIHLFYN